MLLGSFGVKLPENDAVIEGDENLARFTKVNNCSMPYIRAATALAAVGRGF